MIYQATRRALEAFDASVIVYELFPFMMTRRDWSARAVQDFFREQGRPLPERVSLCRDIIHSKNPAGVLDRLHRYCSRLMVRGDSQFARLEESQGDWADINLPIDYVGNFVDEGVLQGRAVPEGPVVIFGGGGFRPEKGDEHFFMEAVKAQSQSKLFGNRDFVFVMSAMTPDDVVDRMLAAATGKVEILPPMDSDNFKALLGGAGMVVTRAGYNTTFELVRMGKNFVVVPRNTDEQLKRAEFLLRGGFSTVVPNQEVSALALAQALDATANIAVDESVSLNFNGAATMASSLISLAEEYDG